MGRVAWKTGGHKHGIPFRAVLALWGPAMLTVSVPARVFAQSPGGPSSGADFLAWLAPIAIIPVVILAALAMVGRVSWAWFMGAILGLAIISSAPELVALFQV